MAGNCNPDENCSTLLLPPVCAQREPRAGRAAQERLSWGWREFGSTSYSHGWGWPGPTWPAAPGPVSRASHPAGLVLGSHTHGCGGVLGHSSLPQPKPSGSASPFLTSRLYTQNLFCSPLLPVNRGGLVEEEGHGPAGQIILRVCHPGSIQGHL